MAIERGGLSDTATHGGMLTGFTLGRSALVACCAAVLMACGSSGGGGGGGGGAAAGGPVPLALLQGPGYAHCGWLAGDEPMTLVFSHAMDPLTLTWDNATYPGTAVWSSATTVTITPSAPPWTPAALNGLNVHVSDTAGVPLIVDPYPQIYSGRGSPYIYVSRDTGNDGNDGRSPTMAAPPGPVQTIAKGILVASATRPSVVLVAASTALVPNTSFAGYDATAGIAMTDGVSLCGGFSTDFATRDPAAHETILVDSNINGGSTGNPISAVIATGFVLYVLGDGTTPATALEGFTLISAGKGANSTLTTNFQVTESAAVAIRGGNLALRNNKVRMAGAQNSYGVFLGANASFPQALLTGNDIHALPGAAAHDIEYGLYIAGAAPIVEWNSIAGPSGPNTVDIYVDATGAGVGGAGIAKITNNLIEGSASALTQNSFGIYVQGGRSRSPTIRSRPEWAAP